MEKTTTKNNKKIIFIKKSYLVFIIFDFNLMQPNKENSTTLILIAEFPIMKLIGKKQKEKFNNESELNLKFLLLNIINTVCNIIIYNQIFLNIYI